MKKFFSLFCVLTICIGLFSCGTTENTSSVDASSDNVSTENTSIENENNKKLKIGMVLIGDENEGYSYSHIEGIKLATTELGLSDNDIIFKYNIGGTAQAYDACVDLAEQGCNLIFATSYGHQSFAQQVAGEYGDIEVVAMTGDTAQKSGLSNFHNAFTKIYEARYIGGVVAGMKIKQLIDENKITDKNKDADGNIKIGYVGAYPYAEVVSGYTAFFLGIKSIIPNIHMDVQYTNSWGDMTAEYEAATALINAGAVIIGQHADTTGAPSAVEELLNAGNICYSVGYNIDMVSAAPHAALTSPTNNWSVYYKYAINCIMNGEKIKTDWAEGFETDAVRWTKLTDNCVSGTEEELEKVKNEIKSETLHVFDINNFTVDGKKIESAYATDTDGDFVADTDEAIFDGYYHESYFKSAPSFTLRIDGIKELN